MTFARPDWVALAPLAALLLALMLGQQWRRLHALWDVYDDPVVRRLVPARVDRFPTVRLACLVLAALAIGFAAAGPEPSGTPEPLAPLDVAVAVDVSLSMNASDTEPTRIERARQVIGQLSDALPSARMVLVVFAGWPYTLVPPTDDPTVVRYFAGSLGADLLQARDQGTSLSTTILHARQALETRPRDGARRVILVLSDGDVHEDEGDVLQAVTEVAADGIDVWTAGVGTSRGVELTSGNDPVVDARGVAVVATLNGRLLGSMAAVGGGRYEDVTEDRGARVLVSGLRELSGDLEGEDAGSTNAVFWLTLLAILLLLWEGGLDAGRLRRPHRPPAVT